MPLKAKTPSSNPFDNDRDVQSRRTEERPPRHHGNDDEQKHSESSRLPDRATVRGSPKLQQVMNNVKDSHVKSGGNSSIVAVDENDENAVVRFLLSNRVYGYPNSDGSVISNYGLFILNNHPLVSIFFANKHHPYNTKKRFIVFICIISFAIGLAYLFFNTSYIHLVKYLRKFRMIHYILMLYLSLSYSLLSTGLSYLNFQRKYFFLTPLQL